MKKFDYERAKNGAQVKTRNGESVRIICFDKKHTDYPIVALVGEDEVIKEYTKGGYHCIGMNTTYDLVMAGKKHSGWINIYRGTYYDGYWLECSTDRHIFETEELAKDAIKNFEYADKYIQTYIEWED